MIGACTIKLIVRVLRFFIRLIFVLSLEVVILGNLVDYREGDQASVNNANEFSIEAVEEADLCVNVRWRAGSVTFVTRAILAVCVAIKGAIGWHNGITVKDISEKGL